MTPDKLSRKSTAWGAVFFFFALAFQVVLIRFILENLRP